MVDFFALMMKVKSISKSCDRSLMLDLGDTGECQHMMDGW